MNFETLKDVAALITVGRGAFDILKATHHRILERKAKALQEEMGKWVEEKLPGLACNEAFAAAWHQFLRAVDAEDREQKVRWFARMMVNGCEGPSEIVFDFSYFAGLLDEISVQELAVLYHIARHQEKKQPAQHIQSYMVDTWMPMISELLRQVQLNPEECEAVLHRLQGKGLFVMYGTDTGAPGVKGRGNVSQLYHRLENLCRFQASELLV